MRGLALLAIAAALPSAAQAQDAEYPVQEVLAEYLRVCDAQPEDIQQALTAWTSNASAAGWQEVRDLPPRDDPSLVLERWTKTFVDGLNASLAAASAEWGGHIADSRLFKKSVGDRTLYISMLGLEQSHSPVIECRLHDRLNQDFRDVPISRRDIESAVGVKVVQSKGYFGEPVYRWGLADAAGQFRLETHFGAYGDRGWPFDPYGVNRRNSDPYASFGLTLVSGWKTLVIPN